MEKRKAIGFYWTLPVPWAGFRDVDSKDIDKAASQSRTIAMQRGAVLAYTRDEGYELIHEAAHVEIAPDRGNKEIGGELRGLVDLADRADARILFVDFGEAIQQRHHHYLREYVGAHSERFEAIALHWSHEEAFHKHFADWREKQADWTSGKAARIAAATARAKVLQAEGLKLPKIAATLEADGLRSATGKPWTADSLRKVLDPKP